MWLTKILKQLFKKPKTTSSVIGVSGLGLIAILATPMIQDHEGLRVSAYLDPIGVPTICYGETLGVKLGDTETVESCNAMLKPRLESFLKEMRACTTVTLPPKTEAAFLSFTYNVGSGTYCKNIARKRLNVGKLVEACEALSLYKYAGGKVFNGLIRRRAEEREMCLLGLEEGGKL